MLIKEEAAASEISTRIKAIQTGHVPDGYKRSKIGIIPEEWLVVRFDKITEKTGRKKLENEDLPAYSINNQIGFCSQSEQFEKDGYSNTCKDGYTVVSKGAFAYNPARINVGSIGLLKDKPQVMISSLYVCFKMSPECDSPFFEYYFKSHRFNYDVNAYTEGSVREYLFYDNFSKISVSFPPLPEQQKIAEILATQDKVIELKEKLLGQKQTQKKWLMQKLLSNDGAIFTLGGVRIDKSGWKKESFLKVFKFLKNNTLSRAEMNETFGEIHNIHYGDILVKYPSVLDCSTDKIPFLNEESQDYKNIDFLQDGDIVIADTAEDYTVGKAVEIFNVNDKKLVAGLHTIACRSQIKFHPMWLGYYMNSEAFHNQLLPLITGIKVSAISKTEISKTELSLPSLPEQQTIAEVLSTTDKEIDLLKSDIEQEKQKKKALMQLLLTGIVRVKVNE